MEKPNVDFRLTVAGAVADDDIIVAEIHVIFNDPVLRIASTFPTSYHLRHRITYFSPDLRRRNFTRTPVEAPNNTSQTGWIFRRRIGHEKGAYNR